MKNTYNVKQELIEHSGEASTGFDFDAVEAALSGQSFTADDTKKIELAISFILDWLLAVDFNDSRALKSIGKRAVAMAWVMNPDRFKQGDAKQIPSLRQLSKQLGFTAPNIAPLTADFSRLTKIFNKFQDHDWRKDKQHEQHEDYSQN